MQVDPANVRVREIVIGRSKLVGVDLRLALSVSCAALIAVIIFSLAQRDDDGCRAYTPVASPLIAHAGGGLPDRTYANSLDAINLAVKHGHTLLELDFLVKGGRLLIGHDAHRISDLTVAELMAWLDRNPSVSIVTDFKTSNLSGLRLLKQSAGDRLRRFIPQIYEPRQFQPTVALGYPAPILTVYRLGDEGWQDEANALPLRAVTMPVERAYLAREIRHPVFLHTVNRPIKGFGLYTDCLIPAAKVRSDRAQ